MKWEILKGSEKDFEGYHEGVTHIYSTPRGAIVSNGEVVTLHGAEVAVRRPITESVNVWDGKGLPPVGVECKHLPAKHCVVPHKVTILSHSKLDSRNIEVAIFQYGDVIGFSDAKQFIPIRSPEDVARDEAAKGLLNFLDGETDRDNVFHLDELVGFYDYIAAGKIPGVKLE